MKLFFDEDTGSSVPRALRLIGLRELDWVSQHRRIRLGTLDEDWLPYVGRSGYLLFSCNKNILDVQAQREVLVSEKVGAVFLSSGQETRVALMRLLLNQWEWLEYIDTNETRPFAFILSVSGRKRRVL